MNFVLTKEQETLEKGLTILLEEHGHAYGEGEISITPVFTDENKLKVEKKRTGCDHLLQREGSFLPRHRPSLQSS